MSLGPSRCLLLAAIVASGCASLPYSLDHTQDRLVGIDVALESAVAMAGGSPARSHITMVRRFVRSSEVHEVCAALGAVMGSTNLATLKLKATGSNATALLLDPSQDLRRLEERMADALHLFSENPADAHEYIATPDRSPMDEAVIAAVYNFVPEHSGVNFRPQLLVAPGQTPAADSVVVNATGLSVYQIGRSGTADRVLWTWTGETGAR